MASVRFTLREVVESGHLLALQLGPGPDGVGAITWNGDQAFTVWFTFDGCTWERAGINQYDPEGSWMVAQNWAAHRLAQLLAEYRT